MRKEKKIPPIYLSAKLKVSKLKAKYIVKSTQDPFDQTLNILFHCVSNCACVSSYVYRTKINL